MAMVVKNNMSAVSTLNTLNKNSSALQKSLQKVSSGMKINSAQDDASGYAISEKMRVQIRSLDQANQNTQNASSLMKTAEGAVSSTVEILKSLKEKAINAATDTNTDQDRATIQKELDQFIDQIDDNALTTFNGKYLVDGSKNNAHRATYASFTNQSLAESTTGITKLAGDLSNRLGESLEIESTDYVTASYVKDGKTHTTTYQVSDTTVQDIFTNLNSIDTAVFGTPDVGTASGGNTPTAAEIVAGLSDKDLASIAKDGKASSVITGAADSDALVAALTELSSTSAADVTAKTQALATELGNVSYDSGGANKNAVSITAADGTTSIATAGIANGATKKLSELQTTETTPRDAHTAFAEEVANVAKAAAATGTLSGADGAQTVATALAATAGDNLTVTSGSPAIGDVINANKKEFHELTRAALVDAAAQKFAPVTVSDKSLVDGSTITTDTSATYTAQAKGMTGYTDGDSGSTDQDTDLKAIATGIAAAVTAGNGKSAATQTGDELLANLQADLANTDVTTAFATDTTTANILDTYKHIVDAYAAKYVDAQAAGGGSGTTTQTDTGLVLSSSQIGVDKNKDNVYTNDGTVGLTVSAANPGVAEQVAGVTISISDSEGNVRKAANAALNNFAMSIRAENQTTGIADANGGTSNTNNVLSFQVGAAANQSIAVNLTDMRSEALGLKGSDGSKVSVATQDKANAAVSVFDNAIQKALDQQTTIGAVESRLDYTSSNLTTMSENVQAAESTIRDADMAKEMTNYTKNNVLLQAAQSMLAQANQSSSQVLSLLQ